ncbi:putative lysine methyltransferase protein [Rosellinia necatrix]|uniref:Putative lysine methyltransferase protein n=1 Tax=Rosellinia necatrix TaxID=77044 RepID=A0A1W2TML4_ROSNE|nr:putative lysine methyltransferase protein [Rosellinia necatrix]
MRASVLYALLPLTNVAWGEAQATKTPSENPASKTCPWNPTIQKLRPPACASPDLIRRVVLPSTSSRQRQQQEQQEKEEEEEGAPGGWHGPEHCVNGTCVFSNAAASGGIALITSPRHARIIQGYGGLSAASHDDGGGGAHPPPFRAEQIPGKGVGLRADRPIAKGEVLLVRAPTLVAQVDALGELEPGTRDQMYAVAMARLPRARRDAFLAQMGRDVHAKIDINSFQLYVHGAGEKGTSHLTCYPDVARLNHDCRPNVHYRITNATITALAARDILSGEELTVSYIDVFLLSRQRKERIRSWGFECACALCQGPKNETVASDKRLRRIAQLKEDLNNFKEVKVTAETGAEYTALHEEEGLHAHLGSAYTRAALNSALFGDEGRSRAYALRAAEELDLEKGPESGDARAMRALADDPRAHWTWGKRRKLDEK